MKIIVNCCLCEDSWEANVEDPMGWTADDMETDGGYCPKHAIISEFESSQCRGCVGCWGDCGLWRSFAYSDSRNMTGEMIESIRAGICPERVNGGFSVTASDRKVTEWDDSERASSESGNALADAILEYIKNFP